MESRLNNQYMIKCATKEAWDILSEEFDWAESLLEKYQENLNWEDIDYKNQTIHIMVME